LRKKISFIEHTVESAVSVFRNAVISEETASRKGFMQDLDPRFKILTVFFLLTSILFTKSAVVLSGLYLICIILALFSRIGLTFFLKRTLVFIPIFSFFIIFPAIFNIITPGSPAGGPAENPGKIFITIEGLRTSGIFILRVTGSVSFAILLALTTRHTVLLKALRKFGIPQIFVMTFGMTYRYLYFLLSIAQNTLLAVKSRSGSVMTSSSGQKIATGTMTGLWTRSYKMHDQVYKAMLSRGYSGEPLSYDEFKFTIKDIIILSTSIIIFTGVLWLNQFFH
jgi:cobalt/nickel transport system permease protein